MSTARARSLALVVGLGAMPSPALAQSPAPVVPSPTAAPMPGPAGAPTPAPTPAPDLPSAASMPAPVDAPAPAPTPADVGPTPTPPAETTAPISPAPTPVAPAAPLATEAEPIEPIEPTARVEVVPPLPRLSLTAGFVFGPHAQGEASCQESDMAYECQHTGNFLGVGGTIELRAQLYRPLFLHVRALVVGNVRQRGVHRGLAGGGIGLGAYSRFAFVRAEYMLIPAFGGDSYYPPFYSKPAGRDVYSVHAGMFSAGVRKYVSNRASIEAWGGLVVGPRAQRTSLSADAAENRVLVSFMLSLGFTYDLLLAKGYVPGPRKRRQPRQWGSS